MTQALLLDENFPRSVADSLAAAGHDVVRVGVVAPGIDDRAVLELARVGARTLLTLDSDFGDLVFRQGAIPPLAIIYFRVHPLTAERLFELATRALEETPAACFAVVTPEGTRLRLFEAPLQSTRE